jgi:hypothetical protein
MSLYYKKNNIVMDEEDEEYLDDGEIIEKYCPICNMKLISPEDLVRFMKSNGFNFDIYENEMRTISSNNIEKFEKLMEEKGKNKNENS